MGTGGRRIEEKDGEHCREGRERGERENGFLTSMFDDRARLLGHN